MELLCRVMKFSKVSGRRNTFGVLYFVIQKITNRLRWHIEIDLSKEFVGELFVVKQKSMGSIPIFDVKNAKTASTY